MSGIYIPDMEMPKGNEVVYIFSNGAVHKCILGVREVIEKSKAVTVPDHGDLIDRQKLLEDNKHLEYPTDCKYRRDRAWAVGFNAGAKHCNEHAYYAKTIIPADEQFGKSKQLADKEGGAK